MNVNFSLSLFDQFESPVSSFLCRYPIIGPEARSFQGHHFDPPAVARGELFPFLAQANHSTT